ncbi:hypothetical protein ACLMLE_09665 [Lysobacter capsici]
MTAWSRRALAPFFKVGMILVVRDTVLSPPLEKGGRGDSLSLSLSLLLSSTQQRKHHPRPQRTSAAILAAIPRTEFGERKPEDPAVRIQIASCRT